MKTGDIIICKEAYGELILDREYIYIKNDYSDYITVKDTITQKVIAGYHKKRFSEK